MTTNIDLTNRALAEIGTRSQITSMTDGSQEAQYANLLYNGVRDFLLREGDYEFATSYVLPVAWSPPIPTPFTYVYGYPVDCVRVKQLVPANWPDIPLDPQPVEYTIVGGLQDIFTKGIATRVQTVLIVYTTNAIIETNWDAMFTEAFVRMLGSALAFSLENRIELSTEKLQEAINFAGMASLKDG